MAGLLCCWLVVSVGVRRQEQPGAVQVLPVAVQVLRGVAQERLAAVLVQLVVVQVLHVAAGA